MSLKLFGYYCDDVRNEVGNKVSLMGCYTSELYLNPFPQVLKKLCCSYTLECSNGIRPQNIKVITTINGEERYKVDVEFNHTKEASPEGLFRFDGGFLMEDLSFDQPSEISTYAICDGERVEGPKLSVMPRPEENKKPAQ